MSELLLGTQKFSLFWLFILQQTNTADMLDLAVEYIKDLQKQVKVLYKLLSVHQNHLKLLFFFAFGREKIPTFNYSYLPLPNLSLSRADTHGYKGKVLVFK